MTSVIQVTPISGTALESDHGRQPFCYLLEIDEAKILLDCGSVDPWCPSPIHTVGASSIDATTLFHRRPPQGYAYLKRYAKQLDAILLSHADLAHCGALPHVIARLGMHCSVYATIPVQALVQVCLYDAYATLVANGGGRVGKDPIVILKQKNDEDHVEWNTGSLADIDMALEKIVPVRYAQPIVLTGRAKGITLAAYAAGHSLGGAVWRIRKETDDIVYAVEFHHRQERHLQGTFLPQLQRPSLLICDTRQALTAQTTRKQRDGEMQENILKTLQQGGNVLMPCQSATRVLELVYILDQIWTRQHLERFGLVLLSHQSARLLAFARSLTEWLGGDLAAASSSSGNNASADKAATSPFSLQHVRTCHSLAELDQIPRPMLVLATDVSMNAGFSRDLFCAWATDARHVVIITEKPAADSLAAWLLEKKADSQEQIQLALPRRVPLDGDSLKAYEWAVKNHKNTEKMNEKDGAENDQGDESDNAEDESDVESKDSSDKDEPLNKIAAAQNATSQSAHWTQHSFDLFVQQQRSRGFFKRTLNQSHRLFPAYESHLSFDDYGQVLPFNAYKAADAMEDDAEMRAQMIHAAEQQQLLQQQQAPTAPVPLAALEAAAEDAAQLLTHRPVEQSLTAPIQWIVDLIPLPVKCRVVRLLDFEGLTDGRSLKTLLSRVAPRHLLLIGGSEATTSNVLDHCKQQQMENVVVVAEKTCHALNVSAAVDLWQVRLSDALLNALRIVRMGDLDLAFCEGWMNESESKSDENDEASAAVVPVLEPIPLSFDEQIADCKLVPESDDQVTLHRCFSVRQPIIVGDVRLSELRRQLQQSLQLSSEFQAGELVIEGQLVVRKGQSGHLQLEGPLCTNYFKVRQLLYSLHALL